MTRKIYEVRLLRFEDRKRFQKFRDLASQNVPEFSRFGITKIRDRDFIYHNLLLLKNGRIESSLCLELLNSWKDFDLRYQKRGPLAGKVKFPCLYTTQAYTRPTSQKRGYNTLLRRIAIELALHWNARSVLSDMIADSPRRQTMLEMGYKAYPHPTGWVDMKIKDKISSLLLDLDKKSEQALQVSEELVHELRRQTKISPKIWKLKPPKVRLDLLIFYESLR